MMDAKDFIRICADECGQHRMCIDCPFGNPFGEAVCVFKFLGKKKISLKEIEETVSVAEKLNHVKTYADDFFEKFPNAKRVNGGTPAPCRDDVYGVKSASCISMNCPHCWNEPYGENDKE